MPTPPMRQKPSLVESLKDQKWITLIALPILIVAMFENIYWIWGLLYIYWGVQSLMSRQVYLLEPIDVDEDPVLYWLIITLWIGAGPLYVQTSFFPTLWS
jgi:hypothetical protein